MLKNIFHICSRKLRREEPAPAELDDKALAHREFFQATEALRKAQDNFNEADFDHINTGLTDLNIATLRVDNAARKLRIAMGFPAPEDLAEERKQAGLPQQVPPMSYELPKTVPWTVTDRKPKVMKEGVRAVGEGAQTAKGKPYVV